MPEVSAGAIVRLAGAGLIVALGSRVKNPEMRYLVIGVIGVAASLADSAWHERMRAKRDEARERCR